MGMIFSYAFIALIIYSFIRRGKRINERKEQLDKRYNMNQNNRTPAGTAQRVEPTQLYSSSAMGQSSNKAAKQVSKLVNKPISKPVQKAGANTAKPVINKKDENQDKRSTTQILQDKARLDQQEHQKEKYQQDKENRQFYGNIRYAERYLMGDSVPKGKKLVYCKYCRAENLIPELEAKGIYNCHFCREKL